MNHKDEKETNSSDAYPTSGSTRAPARGWKPSAHDYEYLEGVVAKALEAAPRTKEPAIDDPTGMVGARIPYKFEYTVTTPPDTKAAIKDWTSTSAPKSLAPDQEGCKITNRERIEDLRKEVLDLREGVSFLTKIVANMNGAINALRNEAAIDKAELEAIGSILDKDLDPLNARVEVVEAGYDVLRESIDETDANLDTAIAQTLEAFGGAHEDMEVVSKLLRSMQKRIELLENPASLEPSRAELADSIKELKIITDGLMFEQGVVNRKNLDAVSQVGNLEARVKELEEALAKRPARFKMMDALPTVIKLLNDPEFVKTGVASRASTAPHTELKSDV